MGERLRHIALELLCVVYDVVGQPGQGVDKVGDLLELLSERGVVLSVLRAELGYLLVKHARDPLEALLVA